MISRTLRALGAQGVPGGNPPNGARAMGMGGGRGKALPCSGVGGRMRLARARIPTIRAPQAESSSEVSLEATAWQRWGVR